jgi:pimeloyl-ACP methyl ester carboxylesterase
MAYEVKQWLENVYGLMGNTYTVRDVQQMTVEQLKSIEQARLLKKSILKRFNYLMPSRLIEKLNDVEYTQEHTPIVVLHPIEGHINMLKSWAKQFKYPVYGIQFTQEAMKYETVEQLASFYWQQIEQELLAKFGMSGVHLFGYNFGVPVAMEMAARKPSRIASLSLLDVAHPIMVNLAKKWLTVDETSIEALYTFAQQYIPTLVKKEFMQLLAKFTTLEQRVKYVVSELLSKSQFQFEPVDLEMAVRAFVHKYFLLAKYQPKQQQLRLPEILLIKSAMKNNCQWTSSFSDEYNFPQMLINGKIQTRLVDGDYRSIFEGQTGNQLATILNEYFLRYF